MADLSLVSVNVQPEAETIQVGARRVDTGIRKLPVASAYVGVDGLQGDVVADRLNHGGPDQAVYAYSLEDLRWWSSELGRELAPGAFGENLTFSGFGGDVRIGDRYRVGDLVLEATAARIPCSVFARHLDEHDWVKRFAAARRPGFYARVLQPGAVAAGATVERLEGGEGHPSILATMDAYYDTSPPAELLHALLAAPVAERARADYEEKLG